MFILKNLFYFTLLFSSLSLSAQSSLKPGLDPEKPLSEFIIDIWKVENGLPQNTVKNIVQSPDGYLWMATHEGLVRFNGIEFVTYDKKSHPIFKTNSFNYLLVDSDSSLWLGSNGAGLYNLKNGTASQFSHQDGLPVDFVRTILKDSKNRIWAGTLGGGIGILENKSFKTISIKDGLQSDLIYSLYEDKSGIIWVGTSNGLNLIQNDKVISNPYKKETDGLYIYCFLSASDGSVWLGTNQGALIIKDGVINHLGKNEGLKNPAITELYEDSREAIWLSTSGGLHRYVNGKMDVLSNIDGLSHTNVWCTFEDKEGSLWIGTTNGLNRLSNRRFASFTKANGLPNDFIRSIYQTKSGDIWIGTDGGGAAKLKNGNLTLYNSGNGLPDDRIFSIFEDSKSGIWLGTGNGVSHLPVNGKSEIINSKNGLSGNVVLSVCEDQTGALYFGTAGGGLNQLVNGKIKDFSNSSALSSNNIRSMFIDRNNRFWVGTNGNGLHEFKNDSLLANTLPGFDTTAIVFAFHEDADGLLWIGTNNGLFRVKGKKVTQFTSADGLLDDLILQILEDDKGNLWLTCNKGPYQVSRSELNNFADGYVASFKIRKFDKTDGMKTIQCNGGSQPAGWKMKNGQIWIPTAEGVVIADPNDLGAPARIPTVLIENMIAGKTVYSGQNEITLEPGNDKLEFHFIGFNFQAPLKVRYKYKLIGFDAEWTFTETRRTAFYTNLPPGTYTFQVLASNPEGIWNETGASLTFTLKPHFWETIWFYLFLALLISGSALYYYKRRVRKLKESERRLRAVIKERTQDIEEQKDRAETALAEVEIAWHEAERAAKVIEEQKQKIVEMDQAKSQFFSNVSHEFRTPLTLTIGPLEHALNGGYGPIPPGLMSQLEMMLRNSRRLLRLINQLLDISKMESGKMTLKASEGNLVSFLKDLSAAFSAYAERRKIHLIFNSSAENALLFFDRDKVDKIFYNLLSNAFKFTNEEGTITVDLQKSPVNEAPGWVEVSISDTGVGIPEQDIPHIFERFRQTSNVSVSGMTGTGIGLALVRDFVDLHGGTISVISKPGIGSTFIVRFKTGKDHLPPEYIIEDAPHISDLMTEENLKLEISDLEQDDLNNHPNQTQNQEPAHRRQEMILVVDDNRDIRNYIKDILKDQYLIREAGNGEEGLESVREHQPDLVISDVMMPVMNGYDFCRILKTDPSTSNIPVILLTAKATGDMKVEGLESGANDYMYKPFYAKELMARVKNLISLYRQELEVKWINQELSTKNEQLREANELKTELLNIAAHDLKNPLQAITGYAEMLTLQNPGNELIAKRTAQISQAAQRMLHQVNELLVSATIDAGKIELKYEKIGLNQLVESITQDLIPSAESKNQKIKLSLNGNKFISGDKGRLGESIENLIGNAIKYSEHGSEIIVSTEKSENSVLVKVTDHGPGLSEEDLKKIFGKFQRLTAKPTGGETSTGLGLSIVKQLVELHGGKVGVTSKLNEGSTFWIELPVVE
ncbi:MAG: response regulator [Bacteroidetes bacterium]|nr:response regulator [Bacteroidota bacterium]